ncbi:uncharacterized protein LOC107632493 [Arachis ipaensis]|uniref:uncharacterized protein LOC107632493 n=1 Tax=Arachis ipaensis TaxID=130454 RepID=UPI000A2B3A94|nr:uncharacterized protein LOC107632493 [Arachis ipaensis]
MVSEREDPTMADNLANPNASPSSNSAADFENFTAFMRQFSQFQAHLGRFSSSSAISDPISHYFLHPGESPGLALIPLKLTPQNYYQWSHDMWRALRSKNKVKFLDGSILKPGEGDPNFEAWDRCNNFLLSWINLSLSPEIAKSVMRISSAPNLWNDLKRRYSQGDVFQVGTLKEEFYALKQGDLTVTSYFAMLKAIWEELENLRAIPSCVACVNGCLCGLQIVRDYASEEYVVKFLKGLNEQYSNVKSQIMLIKPLPEINTRCKTQLEAVHFLEEVQFVVVHFLEEAEDVDEIPAEDSRSSSEAEYRALANGTCELVWLLKLLKEFNILPPLPVDIFCDNKSAIYIASNPVFHERTKHVEVDCHVARNKFKEGVSNLRHVVSSEQPADLFTKSLPPGPFSHLLSKLGLLDLHKPRNTSLRGM